MAHDPPAHLALHLRVVDRANDVVLIEVEGELRDSTRERWFALLRGVVGRHAQGMVIDLRGCRGIDEDCVEALLAAAATIRARGGGGASLLTLPGALLTQRIRHRIGDEVRMDASLDSAVLAVGERTTPAPFLVSVGSEDGTATVTVDGEFDLASKDQFQAAVDKALTLESPLIVDLARCRFIDSTGIAQLIRASQLAAGRGFGLVASGPQVHRVIDLVGIPDVMATFDSREEARRSLVSTG